MTAMTDRIHSITVVLAADIREDDAQILIDAMKQFKGVLSAEGNVSDQLCNYVVESRVRNELTQALLQVVYPKAVKT